MAPMPSTAAFSQWTSLEKAKINTAEAFITPASTFLVALALRIASPFIVFSLIVNLGIGIAGKLTPQIQVYFIAGPFVVFAGLVLLYFTFRPILEMFMAGFSSWLTSG